MNASYMRCVHIIQYDMHGLANMQTDKKKICLSIRMPYADAVKKPPKNYLNNSINPTRKRQQLQQKQTKKNNRVELDDLGLLVRYLYTLYTAQSSYHRHTQHINVFFLL